MQQPWNDPRGAAALSLPFCLPLPTAYTAPAPQLPPTATHTATHPYPRTGVDVKQVVARHAWLAWHARWDHNQVSPIQSIRQLARPSVRRHTGVRVDVRQVSSHACGGRHIIQAELFHTEGAAGGGVAEREGLRQKGSAA